MKKRNLIMVGILFFLLAITALFLQSVRRTSMIIRTRSWDSRTEMSE